MRAILILLALSGVAIADDEPQLSGHEVIEIEGSPPTPKVPAKPKKRYLGTGTELDNTFLRPAPEYSEEAILSDAWELAWVLLDIDETGKVTRVKLLKVPGHDLEKLAVKTAMKLEFEPAIGNDGRPARSWLAMPIEWPSYWWLVQFTGLATGIPDTSHVPCAGSGPMHLDSLHPTYKDCGRPDWKRASTARWLTK